jgi:hypothetical protein
MNEEEIKECENELKEIHKRGTEIEEQKLRDEEMRKCEIELKEIRQGRMENREELYDVENIIEKYLSGMPHTFGYNSSGFESVGINFPEDNETILKMFNLFIELHNKFRNRIIMYIHRKDEVRMLYIFRK